jgi:hypothetical protein
LLIDLRSLNERVEDVENTVTTPCIWIGAEDFDFFFIVGLSRNLVSVRAKVVELIDELIDDIPSPVVLSISQLCIKQRPGDFSYGWRFEVHRSVRIQDEVEQAAVVIVTREFDLERCRKV